MQNTFNPLPRNCATEINMSEVSAYCMSTFPAQEQRCVENWNFDPQDVQYHKRYQESPTAVRQLTYSENKIISGHHDANLWNRNKGEVPSYRDELAYDAERTGRQSSENIQQPQFI